MQLILCIRTICTCRLRNNTYVNSINSTWKFFLDVGKVICRRILKLKLILLYVFKFPILMTPQPFSMNLSLGVFVYLLCAVSSTHSLRLFDISTRHHNRRKCACYFTPNCLIFPFLSRHGIFVSADSGKVTETESTAHLSISIFLTLFGSQLQ